MTMKPVTSVMPAPCTIGMRYRRSNSSWRSGASGAELLVMNRRAGTSAAVTDSGRSLSMLMGIAICALLGIAKLLGAR
jgi:hypothetical protein